MIAAARETLHALLTTDPLFTADMQALGLASDNSAKVPAVRSGNRPFKQINQAEYPCWIDDAGDQNPAALGSLGGDTDGLVINSTQQDWIGEIDLSLVWHQQDHARSVWQTDRVLPALVRLLLRNPSLGDTCAFAFVARAGGDSGIAHPTHGVFVTLRCAYTIERDMP